MKWSSFKDHSHLTCVPHLTSYLHISYLLCILLSAFYLHVFSLYHFTCMFFSLTFYLHIFSLSHSTCMFPLLSHSICISHFHITLLCLILHHICTYNLYFTCPQVYMTPSQSLFSSDCLTLSVSLIKEDSHAAVRHEKKENIVRSDERVAWN